ncbi:MAG TPA: hypothetical protein VIJ12_02905 [Candidatus Baltobacteraceae bacterium]
MSPEAITAVSSVLTTLVIGATAVAAVVQLRHMRTGNAIEAVLSFRAILEDDEHRAATRLLRSGALSRAFDDPLFLQYLYRVSNRLPFEDIPQEYVDLAQAAVSIGNAFELIGGMVRNRIAPAHLFLQNYWWVVENSWTQLQDWVAMARDYTGNQGLFEDFEFLTVAARKWAKEHPNSYARGVARIPLVNRFPLDRQPWYREERP